MRVFWIKNSRPICNASCVDLIFQPTALLSMRLGEGQRDVPPMLAMYSM